MVKPKRHGREEWLASALEILAREGEAELRIDRLCRHLGVTKGSFYWHFRNRADFVRSLAEFWNETFTREIGVGASAFDDPAERLRYIIQSVLHGDITRYDVPIRAWATHDASVAAVVRKSDRFRFRTVRSALQEMGFSGRELEFRARLFVAFAGFESSLGLETSRKQRHSEAELFLKLVTAT